MVAIWALLLGMIPINTISPQANIAALQRTESGAVAAIYYWKAKPGKLEAQSLRTRYRRTDRSRRSAARRVHLSYDLRVPETRLAMDSYAYLYLEGSRTT